MTESCSHGSGRGGKPAWIRSKMPGGEAYQRLRQIVDTHRLHTVCASAKCPNLGECWQHGIATFMILGDVCTRSCGFCHVKTGRPPVLDRDEPRRVAASVALMNLDHVVITSVTRDELPDGGAGVWARCAHAYRCASTCARMRSRSRARMRARVRARAGTGVACARTAALAACHVL